MEVKAVCGHMKIYGAKGEWMQAHVAVHMQADILTYTLAGSGVSPSVVVNVVASTDVGNPRRGICPENVLPLHF